MSKGKKNKGQRERDKARKRLLSIEDKLMVTREESGGGGWDKLVLGIRKGTCWDEHWVLYISNESLNSTPETIIILYIN